VKKNVWSARIILDEAESAVCVPHFQCTGGHLLSLLQPERDEAADRFCTRGLVRLFPRPPVQRDQRIGL
jgi:hypothetical protein